MSLNQNEKNDNAPHQAVISITCQIMERLPTGQVTGIPVKRIGRVYTVNGRNRLECEENLQKFLEKLK